MIEKDKVMLNKYVREEHSDKGIEQEVWRN
jgi:hypothetical protein